LILSDRWAVAVSDHQEQGAILSAKLPHLAHCTGARQDTAKTYDAGLNQIEDVVIPAVARDRTHAYHLYTIRHPRGAGSVIVRSSSLRHTVIKAALCRVRCWPK
jgi:dTDP-4-amino-4,6-dideoxygalactose transaminase